MIRQGDVYWLEVREPIGPGPGYRHPHAVVQNDLLNASGIRTVVVCALSSDLRRADAPGNVLVNPEEGGLPRQSVVNVSQIFTVDKDELQARAGSLSPARVRQIVNGIRLLIEPRDWE